MSVSLPRGVSLRCLNLKLRNRSRTPCGRGEAKKLFLVVNLCHCRLCHTLSKIAKAHGTTVAELKRLNGFDDVRANNLIAGEIIKVPQPKPNTVNEVKGGRRLAGEIIEVPQPRETPQK